MARTVRCCLDCGQRFISNNGVTFCEGCSKQRSSTTTRSSASDDERNEITTSIVMEDVVTTVERECVEILSDDIGDGQSGKEEDAISEGGDDFLCTQLVEDGENSKHECFHQNATKNDPSKQGISETSLNIMDVSVPLKSINTIGETRPKRSQRSDGQTVSNENDDDICFICGVGLSKVKHRINHIKRCSKKHAIVGRDVRDDSQMNLPTDDARHVVPTIKPNQSNPYNRPSDWHGDANKLLQISSNTVVPFTNIKMIEGATSTQQSAPQRQQSSLTSFFTMPVRNLNNVLMAASRRVSTESQLVLDQKKKRAAEASAGSKTIGKRGRFSNQRYNPGGKSGSWSRKASEYNCPQYKKIPGSDFVVDGFHYAKETLTSNYFLTHFHSDHYGGIGSTWHAGTIYCSLPTANLVNQQLGVNKKYLHPLPLNTPTVVSSRGKPIIVTLLDANHCPGAVMFLFQVGKRKILHVGDFRWSREVMLQHQPLREIYSKQAELEQLFLDTTYCNPKYTLPPQNETVNEVIRIFEKQKSLGIRTLHLFGAYTIGKEKMFLTVAEHFGLKVYVDKARYRVLSALEWPKERMRLLTTKKEESSLWVIPLGHINMKKMPDYFSMANDKPFSPAYDHIVGYRPTGWSLSSKPSDGLVTTRSCDNLTIHSLPYSEHSSFVELVDCIACLRPAKIVPTVGASNSEEQVALLLRGLRDKQIQSKLFCK